MRRLISDRSTSGGSGSDESDLLYFLQSYDKLDAHSLCSERIDARQVVAWVFINGQWESYSRPQKKGSGSWCQVYLTSILGLNPAQYDKAKKELFKSDGLSGVYKHHSKAIYALVYKPSSGLSASSIAALAVGGVAATGLGGFAVRHAIKKGKSNGNPAKPAQVPVVNSRKSVANSMRSEDSSDDSLEDPLLSQWKRFVSSYAENSQWLSDWDEQSRKFLTDNMDRILTHDDFPKLLNVHYFLNESILGGFNNAKITYEAIEGLIASKKTQKQLISEITKKKPIDYEAWRQSAFWNSPEGDAYAKLQPSTRVIADSLLAREQFESIVKSVDSGEDGVLLYDLNKLIENKSRPDAVYYQAVFDQLIDKYRDDRMDIYLALLTADLPQQNKADIKREYEQAIRKDIEKLSGIVITEDNTDEVLKSIKRLHRLTYYYSQLSDADTELVQKAREQQNSSQRRLDRFQILKANEASEQSLFDKIRSYDAYQEWSADDLGGLIQFADTFINEHDDTEYLQKFRLTAGPQVLKKYKEIDDFSIFSDGTLVYKLKAMKENRIQDLVNKLKLDDVTLEKLAPSAKELDNIREDIQQLETILSDYEDDWGEKSEKTISDTDIDSGIAKAQISKTSDLLKLVEPLLQ